MSEQSRVQARKSGRAILSNSFRPFFLGGALWAAVVVPLWVHASENGMALPSAFDPRHWHIHEMLFGQIAAIVTGFLFTAIPNWTGRLPIAGPPLGFLFLIWLAGRLAVLFGSVIGPWPTLFIDAAFLVTVFGLALREIATGRNWRNLPVAGVVAAIASANILMLLGPATAWETGELGWRLGLSAVLLLITLIGGRIVPSFTRNWLHARGVKTLPAPFATIDKLALASGGLALVAFTIDVPGRVTGGLLLIASAMHGLRLVRWQGMRTFAEPLVTILHLGYAWVPVGFAILGLALLTDAPWRSAGVHALTAGAIGTMTLAVMTRASLGHTGHRLHAGPGTVAIYVLVTIGTMLRVAWALAPDLGHVAVAGAGFTWAGAYLLFALLYGPILLGGRSRYL